MDLRLAGWAVRGAEAYRLFESSGAAYAYAGTWGVVKPVYFGPDIPQHKFTIHGPGVVGADNCQVCGRWVNEPETPICKEVS